MLVAFRTLLEAGDNNEYTFAVDVASGLACEDGVGGRVRVNACRVPADTEGNGDGESECAVT
jgi:hypothetical protein